MKHPTSKNVLINTLGNYLNVVFTALFAFILVRILEPSQYGVMSVLLGIAYVLTNILDFGTTATIYSYLPKLYYDKSFGLYRFIKSTFFYQSLFSVIVLVILMAGFPYLDRVFFKTNAPVQDLYLTLISVLLFIWQNFILNTLFAAKKFVRANIYLNVSNILKTIVIIYMAVVHSVTVGSIIFVFGILGPAIFFLLVFIEKRGMVLLLAKAPIKREDFRFGYTLTYFVASQFFNLGLRMDLFLLSYHGLKDEVGYYGLSQKIILTVISTIVSITQVVSPGFSDIHTKKELANHIKKASLYLLLPTFIFAVIFLMPSFVSKFVYSLAFTDKFVQAEPITRLLSLPFIIYALGSIPMLFLLYTVKKPKYILYSNITFFLVITIGCFYLIPIKGVYGPPMAILFGFLVSIIYLTIMSIIEYRKLKRTIQ